uniref:Uncharacterized protein n=1 Tax=Romanomermis culicivorax TaxID=13658 RepID=A0A915KIS2_ROMCU
MGSFKTKGSNENGRKSMEYHDVPDVKRSTGSMRDKKAAAKCQHYKAIASRVDALSRILFPMAFVIVCTIYWSMYLGT